MKCPFCKAILKCGCRACRLYRRDEPGEHMIPVEEDFGYGAISCPICGIVLHEDEWNEIDIDQNGGQYE